MNPLPSTRVALVTGASKGLGRSIAQKLAATGHRVIINYHSSSSAAASVVESINAAGGEAHAIKADVRDPDSVSALVQSAARIYGLPEIVVHNATGLQPMLPIEQYSWSDFQTQLDFFVKAPVLLTKATLASMRQAQWGRIILIGSEVVNLGNRNFSAYVSAKAAMVGLTRAWASEFGPSQITVNLVAPGWIPVERHDGTPVSELDAYCKNVPLQRQGTPADIASAVAFLASDEAGFISGQCISVNGGNTF
jgi:3-oxoacyl-[acyl-carrier protein] reductase